MYYVPPKILYRALSYYTRFGCVVINLAWRMRVLTAACIYNMPKRKSDTIAADDTLNSESKKPKKCQDDQLKKFITFAEKEDTLIAGELARGKQKKKKKKRTKSRIIWRCSLLAIAGMHLHWAG